MYTGEVTVSHLYRESNGQPSIQGDRNRQSIQKGGAVGHLYRERGILDLGGRTSTVSQDKIPTCGSYESFPQGT